MTDELTRRRMLRASAAATLGLGSIGTASASGIPTHGSSPPDDLEAERVPTLDLSDAQMQTEAVSGVPEQASGIRPGSQMFISYPDGTTAGCTANFIWEDSRNGKLYIGAAGHCFLPSDKSASRRAATPEEKRNGEAYDVKQLDVSVCADCTFGGISGFVVGGETIELGDVVYARQVAPNSDGGFYEEVGHDFGLVEIPRDKESAVDPSLPQYGGPKGVSNDAVPEGDPINQYGAGVANGEVYPTMGSNGVSFGSQDPDGESWYAGIRASPGDSGSPIQSTAVSGNGAEGEDAAGILTHLTTLGTAGTTIGQCKAMAERDINLPVEVVLAN